MAKESVYRKSTSTSSHALIGRLIEHPEHGVGLVTGHIIYPSGRLDQRSRSVYQVMWPGNAVVHNLSRREVDACSIVSAELPPD